MKKTEVTIGLLVCGILLLAFSSNSKPVSSTSSSTSSEVIEIGSEESPSQEQELDSFPETAQASNSQAGLDTEYDANEQMSTFDPPPKTTSYSPLQNQPHLSSPSSSYAPLWGGHDFDLPTDESEPTKFSGTREMEVYNNESGSTYTLEVDVEDGEVEAIHFPNGGYATMMSGEVDADGSGDGVDTQGRSWTFEGYED